MSHRFTVGVVGYGFVGRATNHLFRKSTKILTLVNDKDPDAVETDGKAGSGHTDEWIPIEQVARDAHVIFVCVPTPMKRDGSCDTSIVESVLLDIEKHTEHSPIVAIRSTMPPRTTSMLGVKHNDAFPVVYVPEFLTEKGWQRDVEGAERVVLGGSLHSTLFVKYLFELAYAAHGIHLPAYHLMTSTEAELMKLACNGFLATKVAFFNEVYALAQKLHLDYETVRAAVVADSRIGESHTKVPGHDGQLGFGGTCLPKDTEDLYAVMREHGTPREVIEAVLTENRSVRKNHDWLKMKGRAVTKDG